MAIPQRSARGLQDRFSIVEFYYDFDTSVKKALSEISPDYARYDALVVCGTHAPRDWEEAIEKINEAWDTGRPFLGICFGHQLAAIAYARRIGIKDATSEEFGVPGTFVVQKLPELNVGLKDGESWWNNYEVVIDTNFPESFCTAQFHPEYESSID